MWLTSAIEIWPTWHTLVTIPFVTSIWVRFVTADFTVFGCTWIWVNCFFCWHFIHLQNRKIDSYLFSQQRLWYVINRLRQADNYELKPSSVCAYTHTIQTDIFVSLSVYIKLCCSLARIWWQTRLRARKFVLNTNSERIFLCFCCSTEIQECILITEWEVSTRHQKF